MGANSTQAYGVFLFFIAFTLISAGLAVYTSIVLLLLGLVLLAVSIALFVKCKPWEQADE